MPRAKFEKGHPRFGGRKRGQPNKVTVEIREYARKLLGGQKYRKVLEKKLYAGELPPQVETMLYHYAYGKPKETVGLEGPDGMNLLAGVMILGGATDLAEWQKRAAEQQRKDEQP